MGCGEGSADFTVNNLSDFRNDFEYFDDDFSVLKNNTMHTSAR